MPDRKTLCLASANPGFTLHNGDEGFRESVSRNLDEHENWANEKMDELKARLAVTPTANFWKELTGGITDVLGAQYSMVSKRIVPGAEDACVEMPELGEPGSCLNSVAFYCNEGETNWLQQDFNYQIYGGPCAHMKHDKTFLVPTGLHDYITHDKRDAYFAKPMESYIGVPLFSDGKCFGHIAAFWSVPGSKHRKVSWGFVEMTLKALQDVVAQRLLSGNSFTKPKETVVPRTAVLSHSVLAAMQSLKPYARSLSHELRTPMHGVVGMLDIMSATVQDALEAPMEQDVVPLLKSLRESIETIQDSSKRAVEAADNVVHAYDLNMEVPDLPTPPKDDDMHSLRGDVSPRSYPVDVPRVAGMKRKSHDAGSEDGQRSPKHRAVGFYDDDRASTPHSAALRSVVHESNHITSLMRHGVARSDRETSPISPSTPGMKVTRVREVVRLVVNESLRFGGRPDSAIAAETPTGEAIEVRNRTSSGDASTKMVNWAVDPAVPEEVLIDERDFAKLISVLFLNALKFTTEGKITLHVSLSPRLRYVVVNVTDTGPGIPAAFRPSLFKAFTQEDNSLTRHNEGLGLGLMVAKGVARRVGGDLSCVRSHTEGPFRGSTFELRIPLTPPSDTTSRHSSPSRSTTPLQLDGPQTPFSESSTYTVSPTMTNHKRDAAAPAKELISSVPANLFASPNLKHDNTLSRASLVSKPAGTINTATETITKITTTPPTPTFDRHLASKYPLNVLVAEDNRINRKLLVNMLRRLGYTSVQEAFDGTEAVRLMELDSKKPVSGGGKVDVILMDLWMPNMDGYEAAKRILHMNGRAAQQRSPKILAVSADVTDEALDRAKQVGMHGYMTKPYKMVDLERLLVEYCAA